MKCLNSSTTDASKNLTNNIYNMALVVAMRKKVKEREQCALTAQNNLQHCFKKTVYTAMCDCAK